MYARTFWIAIEKDFGLFSATAPTGSGESRSKNSPTALVAEATTGVPEASDSRAATPHFASFVEPYLSDKQSQIVEAVCVAAEGLGYSPLEVALAWVRDAPAVTSVILGARTGAQLRGALSSEEVTLPEVVRSALNEISRVS